MGSSRPFLRLSAGAALLVVATLLVLASALVGEDRTSSRSDLASVDLGLPFPWLHQDQRALDPPLPTDLGPASPWENPTDVAFVTLLADVALVVAVLAVLAWVLVRVVDRLVDRRGSASRVDSLDA